MHQARAAVNALDIADTDQIIGYGRKDALFQFLAADGPAVGTTDVAEVRDGQFLLAMGAAVAVFRHDRVGTEAMRAFEDATQQVSGPVRPVQIVRGRMRKVLLNDSLAGLGGRPKFVRDDAELRHFPDNPLILRVETRNAFLRVGILPIHILQNFVILCWKRIMKYLVSACSFYFSQASIPRASRNKSAVLENGVSQRLRQLRTVPAD